MAQLVDGTDNVFVLGIRPDAVVPAQDRAQVDDMLTESLALQYTQIDDFISELAKNHGTKAEIIKFGTLMKHLQSECVFHLSGLAAAAIIALQKERAELEKKLEKANSEGYSEGMAIGMEIEADR